MIPNFSALEKILDSLSSSINQDEREKILRSALNAQSLGSLCEISKDFIQKIESEAKRMMQLKLYQSALPYLEFLTLFYPDNEIYWLLLGSALTEEGEYNKALKALSMATIANPDNPLPYYFSAHCYISLKENSDAELCIKNTIELSHNNPKLLKEAKLLHVQFITNTINIKERP